MTRWSFSNQCFLILSLVTLCIGLSSRQGIEFSASNSFSIGGKGVFKEIISAGVTHQCKAVPLSQLLTHVRYWFYADLQVYFVEEQALIKIKQGHWVINQNQRNVTHTSTRREGQIRGIL